MTNKDLDYERMANDLVAQEYAESISYYHDTNTAMVHGSKGKFATQVVDPFVVTREGLLQLRALKDFNGVYAKPYNGEWQGISLKHYGKRTDYEYNIPSEAEQIVIERIYEVK